MKNQLGLKAITLISLCLFAWSGYVCAAPPAEGKYTVFSATGGHMKKNDVFEILAITNTANFKLKPSVSLKFDWQATADTFDMTSETISGDIALCGFVDIDTYKHLGNKYGHEKTHGILITAIDDDPLTGKPRVEIIWSALPLKNKGKNLCKDLEKRFHGGMAHASQ